jgi:hypothetical protein
MVLSELVSALMGLDARVARAIVAEALTGGLDWSAVQAPLALHGAELSVAAGIVELLSARAHVPAPEWTKSVGPAPEPVWLVAVAHRPRLRARLLTESPEPLRNRRVYAPDDFLSAA